MLGFPSAEGRASGVTGAFAFPARARIWASGMSERFMSHLPETPGELPWSVRCQRVAPFHGAIWRGRSTPHSAW